DTLSLPLGLADTGAVEDAHIGANPGILVDDRALEHATGANPDRWNPAGQIFPALPLHLIMIGPHDHAILDTGAGRNPAADADDRVADLCILDMAPFADQ